MSAQQSRIWKSPKQHAFKFDRVGGHGQFVGFAVDLGFAKLVPQSEQVLVHGRYARPVTWQIAECQVMEGGLQLAMEIAAGTGQFSRQRTCRQVPAALVGHMDLPLETLDLQPGVVRHLDRAGRAARLGRHGHGWRWPPARVLCRSCSWKLLKWLAQERGLSGGCHHPTPTGP